MDVTFVSPDAAADALIVPVFQNGELCAAGAEIDAASGGAVSRALKSSRMTGKPGQTLVIVAPAGLDAGRIVLVGLGKKGETEVNTLERAAAGAVRVLATSGASSAVLRFENAADGVEDLARAALGAHMASYRFDVYRTKLPADKKPSLKKFMVATNDKTPARAAWKASGAVAAGVELSRNLVMEPANILFPEEFAERASELKDLGVDVRVLGEDEMEELGMHALLGVGQGSIRESQLVVMQWKGGKAKDRPVAFVGKGVCFDTGGISLKPGEGMWDMKGDMGGAAAVTGAMRAIAGRKAKANVVGIIGLVENMPDAAAQRPGDIVTSASGQTIEVLNTDAEGRLVLADALWYAQEHFKPKVMLDIATLTGAIIISLANEHAGLFTSKDALAEKLSAAGLAVDETVWRMPMTKGYDKLIDTPNADMKNIGGRGGGSVTAAKFLERFINKGVDWAHIDIASTGWKPKNDDPRQPAWATGWGVRFFDRFVADNFEG